MNFHVMNYGVMPLDGIIEFETNQTLSGEKTGRIHLQNGDELMRIRLRVESLSQIVKKRFFIVNGLIERTHEDGKPYFEEIQIKRV